MVEIHPFRALRYNTQQIPDLAAVVAPPYDIIAPAQQDELHARHPHNVVRLILGKESSSDTPQDNKYLRARRLLDAWQQSGHLQRDPEPAVYLERHRFAWGGRSHERVGFFAALRLEEPGRGQVWPHEATFEGPKRDRDQLVKAVGANLSPILCFYDSSNGLQSVWTAAMRAEPTCVIQREGQTHEVWRITAPDLIQTIQTQLRSQPVVIGDGHHRYEVGWANRATYPYILTYFTGLRDPGTLILPIHRAIRLPQARSAAQWSAELSRLGRLTSYTELASLLAALTQEPADAYSFGIYTPQRYWLLRLPAPKAPLLSLTSLDVWQLHQEVLPRLAPGFEATEERCIYCKEPAEAVALVERGERQAAFLLRAVPPTTLMALARAGARLPQKSTYIYPKVLTGIVINPFVC